jgi:hypothetical protein
LHGDNQTILKERYTFDHNPDVISNEVTVFDHALTRLCIVTKLSPQSRPAAVVVEDNCMENNYQYRHPGRTVVSRRRRNAHAYKERSATS